MKLIRDQGLCWPDIQRVLDTDRRSRSGPKRTGCAAGETRNHRGGEIASTARVATNKYYYQGDRAISEFFERWDQRTQVCRPNRFTDRDSGSSRSTDVFVSRAECAATEKTMCFASPALPTSTVESNILLQRYQRRSGGREMSRETMMTTDCLPKWRMILPQNRKWGMRCSRIVRK